MSNVVIKFGLDGLDFDREYPNGAGMSCNTASPEDTDNFLSFIQELRATNLTFILTTPVGIKPWRNANGMPSADVSGFVDVLDYAAMMNYDEFGQWSKTAGPNAPVNDTYTPTASQQDSAVSAIKAWTDAGMPVSQFVLGVASYGRALNVSTTNTFLASSSSTTSPLTELALFPAFDKWSLSPGEILPIECGQPAAKDIFFNFPLCFVMGSSLQRVLLHREYMPATTSACRPRFCTTRPRPCWLSMMMHADFSAKGTFIKQMGLKGFAMWKASRDHDDILGNAVRGGIGL